jgi:hypothetical protein
MMCRNLLMMAAALALTASAAGSARSADEPTPEMIREYAFDYMKQFPKSMSDRQIASQLASTIFFLEKIQLVCPTYFFVNAKRVRFSYLLRLGTWGTMFGPGRTATSILNETSAKRNADFNNTVNKQEWCERAKELGTKAFGWDWLFEAGELLDWTQGVEVVERRRDSKEG